MIRDDELETVAALPLFSALDPETRQRLLRHGLMQQAPAGTVLFNEGDRPDFLHILIEGKVELLAHEGGRPRAVVEVLQPLDSFILAAVVTDTRCLMTARTYERSRLLLLPAEHLRTELCRQPRVALMLLAALAGQYRTMVRQIKNLKLRTATERVGCFLLVLAREQGGTGAVTLPYSKRVLAERLGMTPENLSRAFAQLRERGVCIDRQGITIADTEALSRYCHPDALIDDVERDLRIPGLERDAPIAHQRPSHDRKGD